MEEKINIAIGIDTSNYTTSAAAVTEDGTILADVRRLLRVAPGQRGLRQSEALFQHTANLPEIMEELARSIRAQEAGQQKKYHICAVAVSSRPRPAEGAYMPVFLAGVSAGRSAAALLGVPCYEFSHQEGHIAAVCGQNDSNRRFLSFHLSGGTGEILTVQGCMPCRIAGGILDLSFGQVLDRVGVAAGLQFPAGAQLDRIACSGRDLVSVHFSRKGRLQIEGGVLAPVKVKGSFANLSGIETQAVAALQSGVPLEKLIAELFYRLSEALVQMTASAAADENLDTVVFAGGVSASSFLREELSRRLEKKGIHTAFGAPELSSDNGCGTAILGMDRWLREKEQSAGGRSV